MSGNIDQKMTIKCLYKRKVELDVYGGQYQNEYRGRCNCGREWVLTEMSELMREISEENEDIRNKV